MPLTETEMREFLERHGEGFAVSLAKGRIDPEDAKQAARIAAAVANEKMPAHLIVQAGMEAYLKTAIKRAVLADLDTESRHRGIVKRLDFSHAPEAEGVEELRRIGMIRGESLIDTIDGVIEAAEASQAALWLERHVCALSPQQSIVVSLTLSGLTSVEIGRMLGISDGTARAYLQAAVAKLRALALEGESGAGGERSGAIGGVGGGRGWSGDFGKKTV